MFDPRTKTDPLRAYVHICWMLLAALFLHVRLVEYTTKMMACSGAVCKRPTGTLMIMREGFPGEGARQVAGLFAREGIAVWAGWGFGLIAPVLLLVMAACIMPKRPWKV